VSNRTLRVQAAIHIPTTPNFLRYGNNNGVIDVAHLGDDDLRKIGAEWTEALITKARKRRAESALTPEGGAS